MGRAGLLRGAGLGPLLRLHQALLLRGGRGGRSRPPAAVGVGQVVADEPG